MPSLNWSDMVLVALSCEIILDQFSYPQSWGQKLAPYCLIVCLQKVDEL